MTTDNIKISFQDYYKRLSELQVDLRDRICSELEFSTKTFYNKINNDSWTALERVAIDKITADFNTELANSFK
jgi:hypothetical protein